mgnify:CR=1 FL=1
MYLLHVFLTIFFCRDSKNALFIVNIMNHDGAGSDDNAPAYPKPLYDRRAAADMSFGADAYISGDRDARGYVTMVVDPAVMVHGGACIHDNIIAYPAYRLYDRALHDARSFPDLSVFRDTGIRGDKRRECIPELFVTVKQVRPSFRITD